MDEYQFGELTEATLSKLKIPLLKKSERDKKSNVKPNVKSNVKKTDSGVLGSEGNISQISGKTAFLGSARTCQQLEQDFENIYRNLRFIEPNIICCIGQDISCVSQNANVLLI